MVHTDFEMDNLIWQPNGFAMLDLDEYTSAWFAADIAKARDERLETGAGIIDGYRSRHPLSATQLASIPLMRRLRALHDYAVLRRACDLPDAFDGPDGLLGLDQRLRAWLRDYERALALDA